MASDPVDSFMETFDPSCVSLSGVNMDGVGSEIFITGGIMNPKELYLTEESDSVLVKDAASSSDSGISAFDDFQDIANVTDLNCLIDGELKDLDLNIDFSFPNVDNDDVFDCAAIVKQEPYSPDSFSTDSGLGGICLQQPVSPEFYNFHNEVTIKEELGSVLSPTANGIVQSGQDITITHDQQQQIIDLFQESQQSVEQWFQPMSPPTSALSPQLNEYIISTSSTPPPPQSALSPQLNEYIISTSSTTSALSSQLNDFIISTSPTPTAKVASPLPATHVQTTQHQQLPNASPHSGHHKHGYIIVPSSAGGNTQRRKIVVRKGSTTGETTTNNLHGVITTQPPVVLSSIKDEVCNTSPSAGPNSVTLAMPSLSSPSSVGAILNKNLRIQPKPGADAKGNLQWVTTASNAMSPQAIPVTNIPVITSTNTVTDEKSLKRAQRIIKNRESACLSRKRKKEYMSSLEERLQQCASDNERLLQENEALRRQVESLQRENIQLKIPGGSSPAKKICLMCFVLLLTLNLSFLSPFGSAPSMSQPSSMSITHKSSGRSLLSLSDDQQDSTEPGYRRRNDTDFWDGRTWERFLDSRSALRFEHELGVLAEKMNSSQQLCGMYFNSTESLRLAEQLRGWMISQEEEKKRKSKKNSAEEAEPQSKVHHPLHHHRDRPQHEQRDVREPRTKHEARRRKKDYPTLRRLGVHALSDGRPATSSVSHGLARYPVQVFGGGFHYRREQLLDAIPRRNDTFYVLSFSTDYFLVPATAHNKTMRPRMSLLMPVISSSLNASQQGQSGNDQVGMMQIDCEILNTNLIHVHKSAFPEQQGGDDSPRPAAAANSTFEGYKQGKDSNDHLLNGGIRSRLFSNISSSNGSKNTFDGTNNKESKNTFDGTNIRSHMKHSNVSRSSNNIKYNTSNSLNSTNDERDAKSTL